MLATANTTEYNSTEYNTQNKLMLNNLIDFYRNEANLNKLLQNIVGDNLPLRIIDWFVTNYAKKNFTTYPIIDKNGVLDRFKVYYEYKLQLKSYSKKRFDPFCRWERVTIPYKNGSLVETTIGQLNFFKWALENNVIDYVESNFEEIKNDMIERNARTNKKENSIVTDNAKTRKKRKELSVSACKSIKKEYVEIVVKFNG